MSTCNFSGTITTSTVESGAQAPIDFTTTVAVNQNPPGSTEYSVTVGQLPVEPPVTADGDTVTISVGQVSGIYYTNGFMTLTVPITFKDTGGYVNGTVNVQLTDDGSISTSATGMNAQGSLVDQNRNVTLVGAGSVPVQVGGVTVKTIGFGVVITGQFGTCLPVPLTPPPATDVVVPDIVGMSSTQATTAASGAKVNLTLTKTAGPPSTWGKVTTQSPVSGTKVVMWTDVHGTLGVNPADQENR
jgi:hypothetical protein